MIIEERRARARARCHINLFYLCFASFHSNSIRAKSSATINLIPGPIRPRESLANANKFVHCLSGAARRHFRLWTPHLPAQNWPSRATRVDVFLIMSRHYPAVLAVDANGLQWAPGARCRTLPSGRLRGAIQISAAQLDHGHICTGSFIAFLLLLRTFLQWTLIKGAQLRQDPM